jgi:hypothetical protein
MSDPRALRRCRAKRGSAVGRACRSLSAGVEGIYSGLVIDLGTLDLEEIASALADQTDDEHRWLVNPQTGEIAFWTPSTGIDRQTPVDLHELDLVSSIHCRPKVQPARLPRCSLRPAAVRQWRSSITAASPPQ